MRNHIVLDEKKFGTLLWLIAGLALVLRAWGMWFGLPYLLHPDESVFANAGMRFGTGDFNPHWFGHPGNILMYILFIEYLGYYCLGFVFGWFDSSQAFSDHFFSDPTVFYLLGRSLGVLSGALSVAAIGYLGKQLVNKRVGIFAALFLAVSSLCVEHAKYIRTDILGTLFVILAVIYGVKYCDYRQGKHAILSSIAAGLAAATKYPLAATGIIILALAFYLWKEQSDQIHHESIWSKFPWKFLLVHGFIVLTAFFCTTPFFFFDFQSALRDLLGETVGNRPLSSASLPLLQNFWWYLSEVLPNSEGMPIILSAALGLLLSLRTFDRRRLMIIVFLIFFFIVIGTANLRHPHWIIPMIPFIGLFAAIALDFVLTRLNLLGISRNHKSLYAIKLTTLIILPLAFVVYPLRESFSHYPEFTLPDTRQLCTEWIRKHIPEGKFAQEFYSFQPYSRHAYSIGEYQFEKYRIYQSFSIADRTLEEYRAAGFTHLIVSSGIYDRYLQEPNRYPREVQFYRSLLSLVPLRTFEPAADSINGPRIAIFAIN